MKQTPKIGLLPMYLALYDECMPEARAEFAPFVEQVADAFTARNVSVVRTEDVCRVSAEFEAATAEFEAQNVDLIVTLHLAYSPSLESADALTRTQLPLLMLDTTMDAGFGRDIGSARIMYNHGIHGVMDLASVLRRSKKQFEIVAGHVSESAVMDRAASAAEAALAAQCLRHTRALRIETAFPGMGDFAVPDRLMDRLLGIAVEPTDMAALAYCMNRVTQAEVEEEIASDRERYECDLPTAVHADSVSIGLGLRHLLEERGCNAFSLNFLAFGQPEAPVGTVPFLEISKAMSRGIGYGGEGDVLSAALVGALARAFGQTTFTEIFCPDWRGDALFLSHMGEINPDVAAEQPRLIEKPFDFTPARNPACLVCAPRPGPAVFVNLAPGPDETFSIIAAPVEVLEDTTNESMENVIRAWIRPECPVPEFLETYSRRGGTHHSALVLGERLEAIVQFAHFARLPCHLIPAVASAAEVCVGV